MFSPGPASLDAVLIFCSDLLHAPVRAFSGDAPQADSSQLRMPQVGRACARVLGVLVGMAGPIGILRIHDIRDWAQREARCHDFFAHRKPLWLDALWQLTCRFEFDRAPRFVVEAEVLHDPWYRWMERTWMLQQLVPAALLYALGGWPWVVWGIFVRIR